MDPSELLPHNHIKETALHALEVPIGTVAITFTVLERVKISSGKDYDPFWSLARLHNRDLVHNLGSREPMRVDSL
jgi:hypothetical protein